MRISHAFVLVLAGLFASGSQAGEKAIGDWTIGMDDDGDYMYAATSNDSGEVLGEYCYFSDGNCIWVLGMKTACEEDDTYPILANSSSGSRHLEVTCFGEVGDGDHLYVFNWKDIEAVSLGAKWMGLAFPMNGDAFKVVRFSLDGIESATKTLEAGFKRAMDSPELRRQGTKSVIL